MKHLGIFIIFSISVLACSNTPKPSEIILQDKALSSVLIPIKELDPKNYASFLVKIDALASSNKYKTETALLQKSQELGIETSSSYFKDAQEKVLINYIENYIAFIKTQIEKDPMLIARIENATIFGNLDSSQLTIVNKDFIERNFRLVIKSALDAPQVFDFSNGENFFNQFLEKFKLKYPDLASTLIQADEKTNTKIYAQAMLQFYEYLLTFKEHEAATVIKYLRSGN